MSIFQEVFLKTAALERKDLPDKIVIRGTTYSGRYNHFIALETTKNTFSTEHLPLAAFVISIPPENILTFSASTLQNGQTHWSNLSAFADELFWLCLTILWGWRLKDWNFWFSDSFIAYKMKH